MADDLLNKLRAKNAKQRLEIARLTKENRQLKEDKAVLHRRVRKLEGRDA